MPFSVMRQIALQGAAVVLVLSLAWPYFGWRAEPLPWGETRLAIGAAAFAFASAARQPWPWRVTHLLAMPLAWALYPG